MNAKNVNEILDALAARFGSTGAHLWGVLQRQAVVEFWTQMLSFGVWLLIFSVALAFLRRMLRGAQDASYSDEGVWVGGAIVAGVVTLISGINVIVGATGVVSALAGALNPEYYALHEVLSALK